MSKSQDRQKKTTSKKAPKPNADEDVQLGDDEIEQMETEATGAFIDSEDGKLSDAEKAKIEGGEATGLGARRRIGERQTEPGPMQLGETVKVHQVQITLPVADTQMPRVGHLDITLGQRGRRGLQRLLAGCLVSGAKLESGKHVNTAAMAARWLIEQIADAK